MANIVHVTCQTKAEIIEEKTNHFDYKRNEFLQTGKEEEKSRQKWHIGRVWIKENRFEESEDLLLYRYKPSSLHQ